MKTLSKFKNVLPLILCLALLISFLSCKDKIQDNSNSSMVNADVPELLKRGEKIQYGKEWDEVQNNYANYMARIKKDSKDHEARLLLAQLYIKEARVTGEHGHYYPAALNVIVDVLADTSTDQQTHFLALMTKAGVQLSLHDFAGAKETGTAAVILNPANAQIHGVLVDANVELGDYDKAVELADRMINLKPDIRSYSRVAYLREIHGDIPGSIQALEMAIKAGYPGTEETAWAMQTLGDLYAQYGDYEKAEKIYNNILEMREDYPFAVGGLGDLYLEKGENRKAEETLNKGIEIIPEVGFYVSLADLYKKEGRTDELNKLMPEIFAMLKDDEDSGHNMNLEFVHIYRDIMDDNAKALEYAQKEYNKRPDNIDVNLAIAQVYSNEGNKDMAIKHMEMAKKTGSKKPTLVELQKRLNS